MDKVFGALLGMIIAMLLMAVGVPPIVLVVMFFVALAVRK